MRELRALIDMLALPFWSDGSRPGRARAVLILRISSPRWGARSRKVSAAPRSVRNATPTSPPPAPGRLGRAAQLLGQRGRRARTAGSRSAMPRPSPAPRAASSARAGRVDDGPRASAARAGAARTRRRPRPIAAMRAPVRSARSRADSVSTARTASTVERGVPVEKTTTSTRAAVERLRRRRAASRPARRR